jgi:hypothetical protein
MPRRPTTSIISIDMACDRGPGPPLTAAGPGGKQILRRSALSLANSCSIGFKSGGAAAVESTHFVEGRCLGSWRRSERQQDHCRPGRQRVHDLPRALAIGGRRFRGGFEPQAAQDAGRVAHFRRRKEAKLIALACSKPPKGRARWTLRLLEKACRLRRRCGYGIRIRYPCARPAGRWTSGQRSTGQAADPGR